MAKSMNMLDEMRKNWNQPFENIKNKWNKDEREKLKEIIDKK